VRERAEDSVGLELLLLCDEQILVIQRKRSVCMQALTAADVLLVYCGSVLTQTGATTLFLVSDEVLVQGFRAYCGSHIGWFCA
jgi:hypothetical protein